MCKYYAHAFACSHVHFTFARFCTPANFTQTPCNRRQIWHTIGLAAPCDECAMWFPDRKWPPVSAAVAAAAAAVPAAADAALDNHPKNHHQHHANALATKKKSAVVGGAGKR